MRVRYDNISLPVISPTAVQAFLSRRLDNWDFMKEADKDDLLDYAHNVAKMKFATDCWQHQLACFNIGTIQPAFLFFLKMGGGKSKIVLDLARYRKRHGELAKGLILVPELLHAASFEEQIKEHAPDLRYRMLLGEKDYRLSELQKPADIFVMNFSGLSVFMSMMTKIKKENRQVVNPKKAADFASNFNFVVFDEVHRVVNTKSTLYQMFSYLSAACSFRYGLTGSSFGRNPTPLWGQFRLIDNGVTLGQSTSLFRRAFFTPKKVYIPGGYGTIEWKFNPKMIGELHRVIKNRSIVYEVEEYCDMPPKLPIRVPVRLRGEGAAYYKRIIDGLIEARGDYRSMKNVFVRMRQCASGFIALRADDESRIELQFKDNPKMDALHDFLLSRPDEKILVFHEFTISGRLIEAMLKQAKIGYASVRGETKDVAGEYSRFLHDPACRIFVLNNQLGSESINPQYVCRRAIFYESPVDPKTREQAEMRVWRPGQKWSVFIHDLMVLGTIEEKIRKYNREGQDLLKAVMSGDESLVIDEEENANSQTIAA